MVDGGRPPSWEIEIRPYLVNSLTDRHQIWYVDAYWPYKPYRQLQIWIFKCPMPLFKNCFNFVYVTFMQPLKPFQQNVAAWQTDILLESTDTDWIRPSTENLFIPSKMCAATAGCSRENIAAWNLKMHRFTSNDAQIDFSHAQFV